MQKEMLTASEAARALGISLDTLRRWDRAGRIKTQRDDANRRLVSVREVERLKGLGATELADGDSAGPASAPPMTRML